MASTPPWATARFSAVPCSKSEPPLEILDELVSADQPEENLNTSDHSNRAIRPEFPCSCWHSGLVLARLLHISPPYPVLGDGLLCNLIKCAAGAD